MKGLVYKNSYLFESTYPRTVNVAYYCPCGTISRRMEPNPALCEKEGMPPMNPFVCTCGQTEFADEFELNDVTLKEDEGRIAVVALGMHYRSKEIYDDEVVGPVTCRLRAWRETEIMTFNKRTGRLYLTSFPSGRIRYFSRIGQWGSEIGSWVQNRPEAWPLLLKLGRAMAERLPEYVVREWEIDVSLFFDDNPPVLTEDQLTLAFREHWASQFERLAVLNAYPHLHFMGRRNILLSDHPTTRRRLRQATGKTGVYQAVSSALSPANIQRLEELMILNKGLPFNMTVLELLPQLTNPDICRQILETEIAVAENKKNLKQFRQKDAYNHKEIINPLSARSVQRFRKVLGISKERYERLILDAVVKERGTSRTVMHLRDSVGLLNTIIARPTGTTDASYERATRDLVMVKGNLKTIHDELSRIMNELESEDRLFPVHEKDIQRYDRVVGDLSFRVVRGTHELTKVARGLRNCVGGYQDRIFAGETLIVAAWRGDKPVICISVQDGTLQEVKLYSNQCPDTESRESPPLVEWLHLTQHASDGTRDLEFIRVLLEGERQSQHAS